MVLSLIFFGIRQWIFANFILGFDLVFLRDGAMHGVELFSIGFKLIDFETFFTCALVSIGRMAVLRKLLAINVAQSEQFPARVESVFPDFSRRYFYFHASAICRSLYGRISNFRWSFYFIRSGRNFTKSHQKGQNPQLSKGIDSYHWGL